MDIEANSGQALSGPKDKSLEAFKTWFMEIVKRLTKAGTEIELTENEWIESWNEYWENKSYSKIIEFGTKANADNYIAAGWELIENRAEPFALGRTIIVYRIGWPHSSGKPFYAAH